MNNKELTTERVVSLEEIRSNREAFPRLKDIPEQEACRLLQPILYKAFMIRGQNLPPEAIAFMAQELRTALMQDEDRAGLPNITIEEIRRETRSAALGNRGEMYGLNVASIYQVLVKYAFGAGRRAEENVLKARKAELEAARSKGPIGAIFMDYFETVKKAIES